MGSVIDVAPPDPEAITPSPPNIPVVGGLSWSIWFRNAPATKFTSEYFRIPLSVYSRVRPETVSGGL